MLKKMVAQLLLASMIFTSIPITVTAEETESIAEIDEIVDIPDASLKEVLLRYDYNNDGELSKTEMGYIYDLTISENELSDLTGLEYAVNMQYLEIGVGNIEDLSPLAQLSKLYSIRIENNNISDISALAEMEGLSTVYLNNNQISDISALGKGKGIGHIELDGNPIEDISLLADYLTWGTQYWINISLRDNEWITKELMYEQLIPEIQNVDVLVGNKVYLDPKLSKIHRIETDAEFSAADVVWNNSNPEIVEIVGEEPHIVAKAVGEAVITGTVGNVERKYLVEVAPHIPDAAAKADTLVTIAGVDQFCGVILDTDNTLWSINSDDCTEPVMTNVQKYIGKDVYGVDRTTYWADYFVLDDENTLWKNTKETIESEYVSEQLYTEVSSFDENTVLLKNGDLHRLETGELIEKDIKQYRYYPISGNLGNIVLKNNGEILDLNTGKVLAEGVDRFYDLYRYDTSDGFESKSGIFFVKEKTGYILEYKEGEYDQVLQIPGVKNVSDTGDYLTMEDGSTQYVSWKARTDTDAGEKIYGWSIEKISDYPLVEECGIYGFIDSKGDLWRYIDEYEHKLVGTNVKESNGSSWYLTNDGKIYEGYLDEFDCVLENVKMYTGGYYLDSENVLYEIVSQGYAESPKEVQKIMTDVRDIKKVYVGTVYIIRMDGSVWKYEGYKSQEGVPYCVRPAVQSGNSNPFTDVQEDAWYYDAVNYNYLAGTMTGKTEATFAPDESLARGQFASILYRIEGSPEVEFKPEFADIEKDIWYTAPILWAKSKNIVNGYANGSFGPGDMITREQMAIMMYNYASSKGHDVSETNDLAAFKDAASVSEYAIEEVQWAVGAGIISGKENGTVLDPQGETARAQCATIVMNYMKKYEE